MNEESLNILCDIAPSLPQLQQSLKGKPYLQAKVREVAILLKEVHINLKNERDNQE